MSAGLSASIERATNFELAVEAEGVEPEYVEAAKNGAITVLMSQNWSPVLAVRLRLFEFKPHEGESSYAAFYNVSHQAALRLLGVTPDAQFNIAWPSE
jgi:hypothetical protein